VRPLYDDGAASATAATRDYTLKVDTSAGAPVLNIFGGKITTYRRLAEHALDKIVPIVGGRAKGWTAGVPLPGGDFPVKGVEAQIKALSAAYPFLSPAWAKRLIRAYGTDAARMLGTATTPADLGRDFGATLTEVEVRWLMTHEFAQRAEDVVWRRNKLGLRMTPDQIAG
jgi:glycerol-3-phosphate dehydrogenase